MKEKTSVTHDQFLAYVKKNVVDYSSRVGEIVKSWNTEKDLKEKYPLYQENSWTSIVLRNCPAFFKNETAKWVKFVSLYIKDVKRKAAQNAAKKEKSATSRIQAIQLSLNF